MSATMGGRIENEFVPYEQALVLKELGFDEPCLGYYTIYSDGEVKLFTSDKGFRNLEASTFSQAFRWFREKYGYYISFFRTHDGNWGTDLWLLGVHKPKATVFGETYEETELACLKKLIEIVKHETGNL
jgi:hypothetical protein